MASRSVRASTRGTTPALRAQITRSKLVEISDEPIPQTAARGSVSNQYGTDDVQPIRSGAADVRKSMSFAAELREQLDEASQPIRSQSQATNRTTESRASTESPTSTRRGTTRKTTPRTKSPSQLSVSRSALDGSIIDDELPSGIGMDRSFDDLHEAGLEMPAESAILSYIRSIALEDIYWVFIYTLPLLILLFFLSPMGAQVINTTGTFVTTKIVASIISSFESASSPILSTQPATVVQPIINASTVIQTVTQSAPTVYVSSKKDSGLAQAMEEIRHELKGIKGHIRTLSDRTDSMEEWKASALRPNFLSPTLGAIIDPRFTSPTNPLGLNLVTRFYRTLYHRVIRDPTSLPPTEALRPWKENGDCWCAAGAPSGQLSLGILLGRDIHPMRLVVEHIPRFAAIDPSSTPRKLDLWARVVIPIGVRARDAVPEEWRDNAKRCESPKPLAHMRDEWVCLGKMQYDINSPSHTQSLLLNGYNEGVTPFRVDRIALRVVENYGQQFTCLYQVKLEGSIMADE